MHLIVDYTPRNFERPFLLNQVKALTHPSADVVCQQCRHSNEPVKADRQLTQRTGNPKSSEWRDWTRLQVQYPSVGCP